MTFRRFFFVLLVALPALLQNCAQVAQPPGGKKDTLAPKLVSSLPKMRQLNYDGKTVELEFDEYVNTENLQQKVTVTPQDSNTFIAKSLPQGVRLTFAKPFQKNTTYTINFADGIKDITERNIAKDAKIVFSTGTTIDSLNLSGNVVDDETRRPLLNFLVGLFASTDTLPITRKRPQYFARTDSNGNYRIENIKAGLYKVYGFDDKDLNLVNNTPNERVAFRDSVLNLDRNYSDVNMVAFRGSTKPRVTRRERTDETLGLELNSGIASYRVTYPNPKKAISTSAVPTSAASTSATSTTDSTKSTGAVSTSAASTVAPNAKNSSDTLISFLEAPKMIRIFRPATRAANDTVNIVIVAVDSVGNQTELKERIYFSPLKTREKDRKPLTVQVLPQTREPIDNNLDFTLTFTKPILRFDPKRVIIGPDSTKPLQLTAADWKWTNNFSQLSIKRATKLTDTLLFKLEKGTFISVQGDTLASYVAKYIIAEEDSYSQIAGKISPSVVPAGANVIVELLDEKYTVLRTSRGSSSYNFSRLKPGKYRVRLIVDANKNGKRDIGNAQKGIQPETIIYQPGTEEDGTIRLRENFELTDIDF
jgi:hypothetical protein